MPNSQKKATIIDEMIEDVVDQSLTPLGLG